MAEEIEQEWLSPTQAMKLTGFGYQYLVARFAPDHPDRIPASRWPGNSKYGVRYKVRRSDLDAWMAAHQ
jgi:hypothetical protein